MLVESHAIFWIDSIPPNGSKVGRSLKIKLKVYDTTDQIMKVYISIFMKSSTSQTVENL